MEREKKYTKRDDRGGGRGDRDDRGGGDDDKGFSFRRRRQRPAVDATFDYKDLETLRNYIGDDGKIVPGRVSRMNRCQQTQLTVAVKRARQLALLPVGPNHGY